MTFLFAEDSRHYRRIRRDPLPNPWIDTLPLCRKWCPDAPGFSLDALAAYVGVTNGGTHRAPADAERLMAVFESVLRERTEIKTLDDMLSATGRSRMRE